MPKPAPALRLAIVGGGSLLGRELRESLSTQNLASHVDLFTDEGEEELTVTDQDGDPVVISPLNRETLSGAKVIFLAGTAKSGSSVRLMAPNATMIDLTGGGTGLMRAPAAEPESYLAPEAAVVRIAHPAAIGLAMFLRRLSKAAAIDHAVVNVFEPASQRGKAGIDELQEQTVGLLSFKSYATAVFDEQISFAMLPRLGPDANPSLQDAEQTLRADLAALLNHDRCASVPALRLVQAPVFHAYAASVWIKFKDPKPLAALERVFRDASWEVRGADEGPPSNTGVAGQSGVTLDLVREDAGDPASFWFWLAMDNLRMIADNALLAAASIIEQSTRRVQ